MLAPIGVWYQRGPDHITSPTVTFSPAVTNTAGAAVDVYSEKINYGTVPDPYCIPTVSDTAAKVQQYLIRANLAMLSARECTVFAFFREPAGTGLVLG